MDFLVVAAVAGAGYAAMSLQSSLDSESNSREQRQQQLSLNLEQELLFKNSMHGQSYDHRLLHQIPDKAFPFRRQAKKDVYDAKTTTTTTTTLSLDPKLVGVGYISNGRVLEIRELDLDSSYQEGHPLEMLTFFIGITIGMMSIITANRREMQKLHDKIKCTENLIQDLQDELEMKEKVTVKELANNAGEKKIFNSPFVLNLEEIGSMNLKLLNQQHKLVYTELMQKKRISSR